MCYISEGTKYLRRPDRQILEHVVTFSDKKSIFYILYNIKLSDLKNRELCVIIDTCINCTWKGKYRCFNMLMKAQMRVEVQHHSFLNSVPDGVDGQHHVQATSPGNSPDTQCTGGWMGPRDCLGGCWEGKLLFPYRFSKPEHCSALYTRVGTLIVATIYLQLIQNRYMFRSFTVTRA